MTTLAQLRAVLDGRKTVLAGLALVLAAVSEGALGQDIPGFEIGPDWMTLVLEGLGLIFLRRGLAKAAEG